MHPNTPGVPYIWVVGVRVGAPASVHSSDRVLGAAGDNCPLSLAVGSHIGFTAARKRRVLKVVVDGTRTQITLLEGYRREGHLGSISNTSCTLSELSTVETRTATTSRPPGTSRPVYRPNGVEQKCRGEWVRRRGTKRSMRCLER